MRSILALALATAVLGCSSDPETTTSTPVDEPLPADQDTDGDFLPDVQEIELGTDPDNPDTDGDSYLDGDEVLEASDPLDPDSKIYIGGWPYQRDKETIVDPGFDGSPEVGQVIPRLVAYDQHGEQVDLYDFAMHGIPVVIDLSAGWCAACMDMSLWLEGEPSNFDVDPKYNAIPEMVDNGEIYWITVVFEDASSAAATADYAKIWYDTYPNPNVTVLADNDRALYDYLWPGGYPALFIVDDDMTLSVYDRFNYTPALDALVD